MGLRLCVNNSFIDVYTRCRVKWNLIFTDPKGELLAKFYYSLSKRQYEVVQFNLLNPNLTNQFNPLINALQEFRQNNDVEGQSQVDSLAGIIFVESENSKGVTKLVTLTEIVTICDVTNSCYRRCVPHVKREFTPMESSRTCE